MLTLGALRGSSSAVLPQRDFGGDDAHKSSKIKYPCSENLTMHIQYVNFFCVST